MSASDPRPTLHGRGAAIQPNNPYFATQQVDDFEQLEGDDEFFAALSRPPTVYFDDQSQSIVARNDSPDVGFNYSVNPYRGCQHGCSYCYARPGHEYLGFSAGIDFETKILVKRRAPQLFRQFLARPQWAPETIMFSGVTDCYQPIERELRLTRGCLEVAAECRQPVSVITKNALITRDIDVLRELAAHRAVRVALSVTSLDADLARVMEPRTSSPAARLRAIAELAAAGVEVTAMVAPIIPGLNDHEAPAILKACGEAGARHADFVLLRLPTTVAPVFLDWLHRHRPNHAERVQSFVRSTRGGELYRSAWRERQRGTGAFAEQIKRSFQVFAKRYGLDGKCEPLNCEAFRPLKPTSGQLALF
ncbi:MAG: radical SAM protein [Planctomycetota bacterium]|nr:MAG: radical SAM protein [Planctomycetota bacterium]